MRKKVLSVFLALAMVLCLAPMTVLAEGEENSWDIANGDITVTATAGGQTVTQGSKSLTVENPVITGSSNQYVLTITAGSGATARVTLSNLNINFDPDNGKAAAIKTSGDGAVIVELDNANKLQGGFEKAGLEKSNGGMLTICDDNETAGSLEATGGCNGSGIGGSKERSGYGITITGGTITATGGSSGAGIGGGYVGNGGNINIAGGTVTAIGGSYGAGIGGGVATSEKGGNGSNITITGGVVVAKGGYGAAGIGGGHATQEVGSCANGSNIAISGGKITAIGGKYGVGIGGGKFYRNVMTFGGEQIVRGVGGYGKDITISGNAQVKVKGGSGDDGKVAAGIGNGTGSTYEGEGQETGDFSGLTEGGFVEYYASGTDVSTAAASYVRHYGNVERHEGDITAVEPVAATCSTKGHTSGIICSGTGENCGAILASEPVDMLPHSYKTEWTTDDTSHWHECSECGAKADEAKHTDTETKDHICDVCGIVLGKCADNLTYVPRKEATAAEAGNTEYWHCDVCGKYFSDKNAENEINSADTVIAKLAPSIIKGDGQTVTEGDKKALEFTSDAAFEDFIRVEVDGKTIDESNYTVKSGSTVVTLNADYVAALSAGEHTLGIVSQSGTATAKITVNEKVAETTTPTTTDNTKSPQTGDNSNIFLWLALLFVSGGAVTVTTIASKKRKYNR